MMNRRLTPIMILSCAAFVGTATTQGFAQSHEVRVEKKVVNGDETIELWIDGKKIKVNSSKELEKILAEHGIDSEVGEKEIRIRIEDEDHEVHEHHADHDDDHAHKDHDKEERQIRVRVPKGEHHFEWRGEGDFDVEAFMKELDIEGLMEGQDFEFEVLEGMDMEDFMQNFDMEMFERDGNVFFFEPDNAEGFNFEFRGMGANEDDEEIDIERRGFLGVYLGEVNAELRETLPIGEDRGLLITQIIDDSPAQHGGLRAGDVVFRMIHDGDEYGIATLEGFTRFIAGLEPGEEIELFVIRDGDDLGFDIEIGKWDDSRVPAPEVDRETIRREWGGEDDRGQNQVETQIEHMHRMIEDMERQIEEMERMLERMERQREEMHRRMERDRDDFDT